MPEELLRRSPLDAKAGPCAYRFWDYPRKGAIWRLPDDTSLVRGPTLVNLPHGKQIRVPANFKMSAASPAQVHDSQDQDSMMKQLANLLQGKAPPSAREQGARPNFDRRPNFFPRQAQLGGDGADGAVQF